VLVELRGMKLRAGSFTGQKPEAGCFLPPMPRSIIASRQHAGAAMARELSASSPAQSFQQRLGQIREAQRSQLHV
jgi:hypothetical protein